MAAAVRRRVNVVETERGRDQPGIEARHVAADHADRFVIEHGHKPPRRVY